MSLKQNRIIKIVMEFVKAGTSYDITGIDLGLAKFFYRESQMLFQDLATGDYTISTGGGKQTLTITNPELLAKIEAFQVAYVLDFDASKYDTQWNVDINTLKDKYNQLLDVTFNVWEYIRKIGFVADDTDMQIILPQLNTGEVWVKTDSGWRGLNVGDIESNINAFWVEFNKKTQEILEQIVVAGKVQEGLLEDFTQQKIKEINEEGLKLEVTQVGHGFIFNAVQFDKTTGAYTKADVNTGADGIAVRIDDDRFYLSSNGIIEIPANAVDSKGNPYELDEYYFLDNEVAGGCTPEKPIHIFQALFCVVNKKGVKSALVEIGDPIDLNPRILVDEINSLGLATTDQVVLSEPTIADLIASKKYKIGDVVLVQGYYTKGDGAGHKRKIEPADDGSGVLLDNGLYANIVHNGEVNVSWFGAKGDFNLNTETGTDNSYYFQKAIDYTNCNQTMFLVVDGKFFISKKITTTGFLMLKGNSFPNRKLFGRPLDSRNKTNPSSMIFVSNDLDVCFEVIGEAQTESFKGRGDTKICIKNIIFESGYKKNEEYANRTPSEITRLIDILATGAPSRPFVFSENQARGFQKVLNFYTFESPAGTNTDVMEITKNEFSSNIYSIHSSGVGNTFAIGNLYFCNNINEQGSKIKIGNAGIMAGAYFNNNLFESETDVLDLEVASGYVEITGNYFEANHGNIRVIGVPLEDNMREEDYPTLFFSNNMGYSSTHTLEIANLKVLQSSVAKAKCSGIIFDYNNNIRHPMGDNKILITDTSIKMSSLISKTSSESSDFSLLPFVQGISSYEDFYGVRYYSGIELSTDNFIVSENEQLCLTFNLTDRAYNIEEKSFEIKIVDISGYVALHKVLNVTKGEKSYTINLKVASNLTGKLIVKTSGLMYITKVMKYKTETNIVNDFREPGIFYGNLSNNAETLEEPCIDENNTMTLK